MQMHSVETNAGTAICCAPSRMARTMGLPSAEIAVDVFDLDRGVVHQDADRQRQSAQRHHVDGFAQQVRMASDVRMESGIEMQTMMVLRQLPRNSRIIRPVSRAAIDGFLQHAVDRGAHEDGLIEHQRELQRRRQRGEDARQHRP